MQPNSVLSINAVEGYPLEDFSADVSSSINYNTTSFLADFSQAVRNQIAEAQKIASGGGSEQDVAEAKIELEVRSKFVRVFGYMLTFKQVLESLQANLK